MFRDIARNAFIAFGVMIGATLTCRNAFAVDKAQVLPKQVNYLSVRFGIVDHLSETYGASGGINFRGEALSKNFDIKNMREFASDEIKVKLDRLEKTLKGMGNSDLATQLNMGTLKFDVDPRIRYTAPVYAHGVTERFTLGIAFPFINYKTNIQMSQVGSNIPQVKQELKAIAENSKELRDGLNELDKSMVERFSKEVADRGYKPIRNRDDSFLGDVQVVGLYHLVRQPRENLVVRTGVILPTGPEDDPDDLTDLENQHQLAIGAGVVNDYSLSNRWTLGSGMYMIARLPDRSTQRVAENENESLPGPERKENLERDLGDSISVNGNIRYQVNDYFEATAGLEAGTRGPDSYSGTRGWDYQVLAKNSYQAWNKSIFALEYSTVTGFVKGRDPIPFTISYDFSDIFAGTNIERQQVHEFSLKMYF